MTVIAKPRFPLLNYPIQKIKFSLLKQNRKPNSNTHKETLVCKFLIICIHYNLGLLHFLNYFI